MTHTHTRHSLRRAYSDDVIEVVASLIRVVVRLSGRMAVSGPDGLEDGVRSDEDSGFTVRQFTLYTVVAK